MADESEDQGDTKSAKGKAPTHGESDSVEDDEHVDESDAEGTDDDGEEDEPKLKYARLTSHLGPVYRNGDATSTFLVAGDKMVGLVKRSAVEYLLNHK
jgi:hypothetical protein